jgi:subtilisin family serine protease
MRNHRPKGSILKSNSRQSTMAFPRALCLAFLLVTTVAQAQQTNPWITVGKHEVHPTRIVARFAGNHDLSHPQAQALLQELGLKVRREYKIVPGLVAFEFDASPLAPQAVAPPPDPELQVAQLLERIMLLRDSGLFRYVHPSHISRIARDPSDARYVDGTLWGLRNLGLLGGVVGADINARQAWDITTGSTNVIVAVLDTGIRYTHQDLRNNMWRNPGEEANGEDTDENGYIDDIHGINVIEGTGDPMDFDDHGTHVAGTIGATANDSFPHVGVAWNVRLMGIRFIGPQGGALDDEIEGIEYAVANGAHVINASYGSYFPNPAQIDAIAAARLAGVLFVAAASNDAINNDELPAFPASHPLDNIISVAALDRADRLAVFSNYGAETVDVGAPGVEIFSSISLGNGTYDLFAGTSMAAPHVSGVAALIRARFPEASVAEVRERILQTVVPIPALDGRTTTGGRVSAHKALIAEPDGELEVSVNPPSGSLLLAGSDQPIFVQVSDVFSVTDATVTGVIEELDITLTFENDGNPPDELEGDNIYTANFEVPSEISSVTIVITVDAPNKEQRVIEVTYSIQPPPPNDDFVNAIKIPPAGIRVTSNNRLATIEPGEPFHADVPSVAATLWWTWSTPSDTPVLIDTAGSAFDTVIAVYTGNDLLDLTEVAAVDDVDGRTQAYLSFDARGGVTYRIVIGGHDETQTGMLELRVQPNGQPDVTPPVVAFDMPSGTTSTTREILVDGTAYDPPPDASGVREVRVSLNEELVGRTALGTTNWTAPFLLREGQNTLSARAVDFAGNMSAPATITVNYMPQDPVNDHFANAALLEGNSGSATGDNIRATKEHNEPNHAGNEGGRSVWWQWTAPADGSLNLTTINSTFDTLLAVYTGDRLSEITLVAANDDAPDEAGNHSVLTVAVRAEVTYRIAVDGYSGLSGEVRLEYSFTPSAVFSLTLVAEAGGSVSPESGDYPANTPITVIATPDSDYEFAAWSGLEPEGLNPNTVTLQGDQTVTATFRLRSFTEDFESGGFRSDLAWDRNPAGSTAAWTVQTNQAAHGMFAARSGAVGHAQSSSVTLTAVLDAGVGSFAYRVSSEANFDKLEFLINDIPQGTWSGQVGWLNHQFSVPAGTNTLAWRYVKDFTIHAGDDAAFLDNIQLPIASPDSAPAKLQLAYLAQETRLELRGLPNRLYIIETSTDLLSWEPIATEIAVNGVIQIYDPQAGQQETRFYRAIKP